MFREKGDIVWEQNCKDECRNEVCDFFIIVIMFVVVDIVDEVRYFSKCISMM